jgi:cell division protein FtsN
MKDLKAKGFDARIEKVMLANGAWYRIMLGPFYDQQEAIISKRRIEQDPRFQPFFIHY